MRFLVFLILSFSFALSLKSQTFSVTGSVVDKKDTTSLIGVAVGLVSKQDSSVIKWAITDTLGKFELSKVEIGEYIFKVNYIGYKPYQREISVASKDVRMRIKLELDAKLLQSVDINGVQTRVTQKGDTSEINANAYKVNTDANVEDLVKKMPGITVENGVVKAQGEDVKKVLIDGKEFFGDDAALALKNLPAEIVDKIQVFDKLSDQSQFTGFNDGNTSKTINVVTKKGMNNGTFGKVYVGYGTDQRYQAGGNLNYFKGDRKLSILGLTNNINQQNFSSQDLLGVSQSSSGGGRRGGGMGKAPDPTSNFMSGQQGGISATNAFGINYSDVWAKKVKISGSYFFNNTNNENESIINRIFFLSQEGGQTYNETSTSESNNFNHRANARLEYTIDTMNTIFFTPQISFQNNRSKNELKGLTSYGEAGLISALTNSNDAKSNGFNTNNNLLYMHKFKKERRTFSLNTSFQLNSQNGRSNLYSTSVYYTASDTGEVVDQKTLTASEGYTFSGTLMYTEPVKKSGQLTFNYSPSYNKNSSDKNTNKMDTIGDSYSVLDSVLSNRFENLVLTQRGGVGFRIRKEKAMFNIGADYQNVYLQGSQVFPSSTMVNKTFNNVLPKIVFRYRFSKTKDIRLFYIARTQIPSVTQLQNVVDNSNPQYLSSGNPDLKQQNTHTFNTRFNQVNPEKGRTLFVWINAAYTQNYITNSTLIAYQDTAISNDVVLSRGSQLSKPVNLQNYYSAKSLVTYGFPVKKIKCNMNLTAGFNYQNSPGLINSTINYATNYNMNAGLVLSSNISEKIDFTVSYIPNYTIVENSLQKSANNNYYIGMASAKVNLMPWKGLVLSTEATHSNYVGLSSTFNQSFLLWNAGLGYKFLKNKSAELRLSVFDILSQNNSVARNITETYVEDVQTKILKQYFMLTFTYNFKKFGNGNAKDTKSANPAN
ncbi:MAG: outer membrane beta-barrel protein [Bacteroidota bacterium]|nr:outer membrane beta-barrel protein [Bacteroidota bacterium]